MSFSNSIHDNKWKYKHDCRRLDSRHQQGFESDVIFLSVPYERIHNLIAAIPVCSAGDAEAVIPEEFQSD